MCWVRWGDWGLKEETISQQNSWKLEDNFSGGSGELAAKSLSTSNKRHMAVIMKRVYGSVPCRRRQAD